MKVILSGGGTGGHIYPALAIAQGLQERVPGVQILYVGTADGMESSIVPRTGLPFTAVNIKGIDRASLLKASQNLAKFPRSIYQGWKIVKDYQPDIVVGTGGYVSFPVLLAATFFPSCRTLIHEQNAMPGLANRQLASRVDCVMLNFEEARRYIKARSLRVTGMPVRREIMDIYLGKRRTPSIYASDDFTLLAFGGSRGAVSINQAMMEVAGRCQEQKMQIIWITGERNFSQVQADLKPVLNRENIKLHLHLMPYMYNIEEALLAADLAVCRAGAGTLSELCLLGLPAILVPYPYAADNHQEYNARALVDKKAADLVIDEFLDGDTLYKRVEALHRDSGLLHEMKQNMKGQANPRALDDILDTIIQVYGQ